MMNLALGLHENLAVPLGLAEECWEGGEAWRVWVGLRALLGEGAGNKVGKVKGQPVLNQWKQSLLL